jgi:hypothetical protein
MRKTLALIAGNAIYYGTALADNSSVNACKGANIGSGQACPQDLPANGVNALTLKIGVIVNLLLYIAGAIAVLVIIYGGIRYITSTGDATRIKQAKDTVLYAVVGLIVAILAYAIVNTVVFQLGG